MNQYILEAIYFSVFMAVTYGLLQVLAIRKRRGLSRIIAGAPLAWMLPIVFTLCLPGSYRDGNLWGLIQVPAWLAAVLYLAFVSLFGSRKCHRCGGPLTQRSFRPSFCPQCDGTAKPAAE
jgi:hypothetical protein